MLENTMMQKRPECNECFLFHSREVPYDIKIGHKILFVGESPVPEEVRSGKVFLGKSGVLLREGIIRVGIPPQMCGFINAARCSINKKEFTLTQINTILKLCRGPVESAIRVVKPKMIVCLGAIALQQVMKIKGIEKMKGKFLHSNEFKLPVFVMNHPSSTLYDPSKLPQFNKHLSMLREFVDNNFEVPDAEVSEYKTVPSIRFLLNKSNITVSVDTETQGLDYFNKDAPTLCVSVSDQPCAGYTMWLEAEVPLDKNPDRTIQWSRIPAGKRQAKMATVGIRRFPQYQRRVEEVKELLARKDIKKVMMNGGYDLMVFYRMFGYKKFELNNYTMDIQAAAHVLDENTYNMTSLEQLVTDLTNLPPLQKSAFRGAITIEDMLSSDPKVVSTYASFDADATLQVAYKLRDKLMEYPRIAKYYAYLVQPALQHVILPMQQHGILMDMSKFPEAKAQIASHMQNKELECVSLIQQYAPAVAMKFQGTGKGLVMTRREIVRDFLYDKEMGYGLQPLLLTDTKKASVSKDVMKLLQEQDVPQEILDFSVAYLEYQEYQTLYTRYLIGMEKHIRESGRIHSSFSLVGTTTGRPNSWNPNLLNLPKRSKSSKIIRELIVAPPGHVLVEADYSQNELRWIAHESQDPEMVRVYREGGDIHVLTAEKVLGKNMSLLSKEEISDARRSAKSVNFGFIYGMGHEKFQRLAYTDYGLTITLDQAKEYQEGYFGTYAGVKAWHNNCISKAHRDKYIDSPFGRRRHLPMIDSTDRMVVSLAERQAINSPIQGAGSDSGLLAGIIINRDQPIDINRCKLWLFIYDALVFCVEESYLSEAYHGIRHVMENLPFHLFGLEMTIPLIADFKVGYNLKDMEDYSE
jgi:uracil-DNA glycosylase family 4